MKKAKDFLKGLTLGFLYFGILRLIITFLFLLLKGEYSLLISLIIEGINILGYLILIKVLHFNMKELFILGVIILINGTTLVITTNFLINTSETLLRYPNIANTIYFLYGFIIFSIGLWKRKSPLL